jgi:hypothetical protein
VVLTDDINRFRADDENVGTVVVPLVDDSDDDDDNDTLFDDVVAIKGDDGLCHNDRPGLARDDDDRWIVPPLALR